MDFRVDSIIKGRPYPALTRHQARPYTQAWREFGQHWPHTTPAELFGHMDDHGVSYKLVTEGSGIYVIGLGFFDFTIDYFSLINDDVLRDIRQGTVTVLFYYHEGDNPHNIKYRLDKLCDRHRLSRECYRFVSGNTAADSIPGFAYFPDHELLYWRRNREQHMVEQHQGQRPYEFLALSRTHKWWRASVMAQLQQSGVLDQSLWSYNTELPLGDNPEDNPIEHQPTVDIDKFMKGGPYRCDDLSADQHNDHSITVADHFTQSYCSIVLETHFDADGSSGAFLTEKTFKVIKNGHPFVIIGPQGSLSTLRELGYRTFDQFINNSYDSVSNNTQRWQQALQAIKQIQSQDMQAWYSACWSDIEHNQRLFASSKTQRLNTLFAQLNI
jgi:hypothetical protein